MTKNQGSTRTAATVVLAVLATVAALYLERDFLVPIALAVVLTVLLRPLVRWMQRWHVPAPLGAAFVVLGLLALLIGAGIALAVPVRGWLSHAPDRFAAAQEKLSRLRAPVQKVVDTAKKLEQSPSAPAATQPAKPAQEGAQVQSLAMQVFGGTTKLLGEASEVILLLFLILATGGLFFQKLMHVVSGPRDKRLAAETVEEAEAVVLRYVLVTALINFVQGVVVALVMWWLGMPTPVVWGLFTFVLEFVPYLGAVVMIALLSIMALATLNGIGHILLAPGSYLLITTLQNNLVSPIAYGRRLRLNPVAVLVGVLFWWFVWGVAGAFLAVPILAMFKVFAERTESLQPLAEFLGE